MKLHILRKGIVGLLLVLLAACAPATAAPNQQEERLKTLESKADMLADIQLDLTSLRFKINQLSGDQAATKELQTQVSDLQAKVDTLSAAIAAIPPTGPANDAAEDPFNVAMVQYVLDSAGFHIMAARLTETKKIDPAYLESVNRAKKVLSHAKLPAALAEQNKAFVAQLDALAVALKDEKADEAADLASKVHGAQHGFTKAIDNWLSTAGTTQ